MLLYHLDLKYSMFKKDYLRKFFERLRLNGYDGIVIEIDNKLKFPSHPEFAAPDALLPEEWYDLATGAKSKGMVVYPLIQTLGHMEHVLYPESKYSYLAEVPGDSYMVCPSKEETCAFVKDLIRDTVAIFDKPRRIHLGGDECRQSGLCPLCYNKPAHEIIGHYLHELADYAVKMDMKPEFWADMFLTYPAMLDTFPKDVRLVNWNYVRTTRFTDCAGHVWGLGEARGESLDFVRESLPDHLRVLEPAMLCVEGKFDNLYALEVLKNRGYEVMLASAARSSGDTYYLPQTALHADNVGFTEQVAGPMGCDHLVTSWAVRLNHPETTWPALLSRKYGQSERLEQVTGSIGGFDQSLLGDIKAAETGFWNIDILDENISRFERPCYGGLMESIRNLHLQENRQEVLESLENRLEASERLTCLLEKRLHEGAGDQHALKHWILGLQVGKLKAWQTLAIMEIYAGTRHVSSLDAAIEQNQALMEEFAELWRQSVTPYSLRNELEVKFNRDIRMLQTITTN